MAAHSALFLRVATNLLLQGLPARQAARSRDRFTLGWRSHRRVARRRQMSRKARRRVTRPSPRQSASRAGVSALSGPCTIWQHGGKESVPRQLCQFVSPWGLAAWRWYDASVNEIVLRTICLLMRRSTAALQPPLN